MSTKKNSCRESVVNVSTITHEQWLEYRRSGIGGSDAATVLGLNPYSSPYYLFCDKMGALPEKEDTESMRQGRDLEQYVADRWMEKTGKRVKRNNTMWRSTKWPWMLADIDREVIGENAGLECKTTSVYNRHDFSSGEVPLTYYVQCQHYMAVMGFDRMYLAVLVLNRGFYDFVIERDESEIGALAFAEERFWEHVTKEDPPMPDGSEATQNALKAMYPKEDGSLELKLPREAEEDLVQYMHLQGMIRELQEECDSIKSRTMDRMGEAALAIAGNAICSWVTRKRTSIDTSALKKKYPEIHKELSKTTEYRMFSVKERKE